MFTGLIQEKGRISRMVKHQHNIKLTCKLVIVWQSMVSV